MRWSVFNECGEYLGVVHADTLEQALERAKQQMPDAARVEPREVRDAR